MEDAKIIRLLFARADSAVEALARKFGGRLMATARNILGSREDAEEAVSDTYFAVWNAIPPTIPDSLPGYVYGVGRNLALKKWRDASAAKRQCAYDLSLEELAGAIPGAALEDAIDARLLGRTIDAFLATLSRENRGLFLRRYWFGDTVAEAGRAFGLKETAAGVRLHRIREKLRQYLIQEGYFDET